MDRCESIFEPRNIRCALPKDHGDLHYAQGVGQWIDADPNAQAWLAPGVPAPKH